MNQSIFIIRHDFFDNPIAGQEFVLKLINNNCTTEKLVMVYDPLSEDFFSHVAKSNRDLFEKIVMDFYAYWENNKNVRPLKWYQLDEMSTFHITFLSPILYEIDKKFGSYLMGALPLLHYEPNMHIFFCMNSGDLEDKFFLINSLEYTRVLEDFISKFNDIVRSSEKVAVKKRK